MKTGMQISGDSILEHFPIDPPFRFVDRITQYNGEEIRGEFHFKENLPCYQGHFRGMPVTPGSLLTECCAQIGLLCFGIGLQILEDGRETISSRENKLPFALVSSQMQFYEPVYPDTEVTVTARKELYRFGRLRVTAEMRDEGGKLICKGQLQGQYALK